MSIIKDWMQSTTCHGISEIFKSTICIGKLFWILIVGILLAITVTQLIDINRRFIDHKWQTTFPNLVMTEFPTITVCNFNRLSKSRSNELNFDNDLISYVFASIPDIATLLHSNTSAKTEQQFVDWKHKHNMKTRDIFAKFGMQCSEMIKMVSIDTDEYDLDCALKSEIIRYKPVFTMEFGLCQQIIIVLSQPILYPGLLSSVSILLNANVDDYVTMAYNNYIDEGFAIQLNYDGQLRIGAWMTLAPGYHHMINMRQLERRTILKSNSFASTFQQFLSLSISTPPCTFDRKLVYLQNFTYTRDLCLVECALKEFVDYCRCIPYIDNGIYPMCETEEIYPCAAQVYAEYKNISNRYDRVCMDACNQQCNSREIDATVTFNRLSSTNQFDDLKQALWPNEDDQPTFTEMRKNYALVDIYFDKLSSQVLECSEQVGFEQFLSQIGGVMGLWAGMSIVTLIHAVVYFLYGICCSIPKQIIDSRKDNDHTINNTKRKKRNVGINVDRIYTITSSA